MRRLFVGLGIGVVALVGAAAHAASLTSADFQFKLGTLGAADFPGAGATGTATSNLQAGLDAGDAFNGNFVTNVTNVDLLSKISVMVTGNDAGNFTGTTPGNVGGEAKISGSSGVFGLNSKLLDVPLSVGIPNTFMKASGGVAITAISAGWTVGKATVTDMGASISHATGSNNLNAQGTGTIKLVSPIKIVANLAGTTPAFGTLTLTYGAPEPALPLMLAAGALTLGIVGARRRRG